MKFTTQVLQQEGFDAVLRITLENGLVLNTRNLVWAGRDEVEETKENFAEFVLSLENANAEKIAEKS